MSAYRDEIAKVIGGTAEEKGYRGGRGQAEMPGMDGLSIFVREYLSGEHQHALGEMLYKMVRFNRKRQLIDIVKAGAWGELIYNAAQPALTPAVVYEPPPTPALRSVRQFAIDRVVAEIERAVKLHGDQAAVFRSNPLRAYAIVAEEMGELAQAMLERSRGGVTGVTHWWIEEQEIDELTQVAAMALYWLENALQAREE